MDSLPAEKKSASGNAIKPVGKTAAAGFQIGVRRTLALSAQEAWDLLVSDEGMRYWIGEVNGFKITPGQTFASSEGTTGELRIVKPLEQLRMKWQRAGWKEPSTLQIRILPAAQGRTTISFHQEKLEDMQARETMKRFWEAALDGISEQVVRMGNL
ncbi:SRPBCC domain-containing protein [Paenibacillus chibensis]|uniref:SRPBCC domain-containing protein n=1 Tax=Paenibacillus chibensis TaxID=59846 RepID=UPI000FDC0C9F|nr:SRPBCC domain-containing protein [Paenibacillus chibensis]MEC0371009.1 SRPBCC domain-containing protein [Paenibacillus chibensis]